jgi:capsular polysaccharide biosynthesis protein
MRHPARRADPLPDVEFLPGRVAVLSGLSGHVYYHWMVDCLPRWDVLRICGIDGETVDAVVVNSLRSPFQRETLERLGIPEGKVVESDRHPHLQADELIVPSFPGAFTWASSQAIAFLRHTFLPLSQNAQRNWPRRIYISRTKAHHRRILNEPAVIEALAPFGIMPIELESLSLAEQIALFAQADIIVAPHGAGLTNLTFCKPGTRVLEIFSPTYVRHEYLVISQQVGLRHWFITGEGLDCTMIRQLMYQSPVTEDIWINITTLQMAMDALMEDPKNWAF